MIFIVGTDHDIQRGISGIREATPNAIAALRELISQVISNNDIQIAFEEMHESERGVDFTVCEQVCLKKVEPIPVRLIDLSHAQRSCMAIDHWASEALRFSKFVDDMRIRDQDTDEDDFDPDLYDKNAVAGMIKKLSHDVRERIWLARMIKANTWPALFICGANHVNSVSRLCAELNLGSSCFYNVKPDPEDGK